MAELDRQRSNQKIAADDRQTLPIGTPPSHKHETGNGSGTRRLQAQQILPNARLGLKLCRFSESQPRGVSRHHARYAFSPTPSYAPSFRCRPDLPAGDANNGRLTNRHATRKALSHSKLTMKNSPKCDKPARESILRRDPVIQRARIADVSNRGGKYSVSLELSQLNFEKFSDRRCLGVVG
jgi:hypothetical protein